MTDTTANEIILRCDKCDFEFKSAYYMHQHFEQVHGVTPDLTLSDYQCHHCSAPFNSQETLKHHLKYVHEKVVKPYLCDKCDKSFRSNGDLQRHMKYTHEGIKEFQCDICDYNASTPQNLTYNDI